MHKERFPRVTSDTFRYLVPLTIVGQAKEAWDTKALVEQEGALLDDTGVRVLKAHGRSSCEPAKQLAN